MIVILGEEEQFTLRPETVELALAAFRNHPEFAGVQTQACALLTLLCTNEGSLVYLAYLTALLRRNLQRVTTRFAKRVPFVWDWPQWLPFRRTLFCRAAELASSRS